MRRQQLLWVVLAVAGLVIAVGVSYAASRLSQPRIGLASEPVTEGANLAPRQQKAEERQEDRAKRAHARTRRRHRGSGSRSITPAAPSPSRAAPTRTAPASPTPAPAPAPAPAPSSGDDRSGHGSDDGGSGGHGSDD